LRQIAKPVRVHKWSRVVRMRNPMTPVRRAEVVQLEADLPHVIYRMEGHGFPVELPGDLPVLSRQALTSVQRQLADGTEMSADVARDEFLQQFRKHLHLLLDH
jgi:hypothetical protein